ncbi:hypothetical protein BJF96_g3361 [Verticillium dahliae]|uniref:Uncharacterized protein n=1 Tax=Verticillium dahliae TaxID=27337 RepID=A0AA44WKK3_VERDA|nr:hypothetical protein BJF96_g3361 [Verticillium dahliae]PNH46334.1 hypothetical protein VD0003_g9033 [Verticillium dahliae]
MMARAFPYASAYSIVASLTTLRPQTAMAECLLAQRVLRAGGPGANDRITYRRAGDKNMAVLGL